MKFSAILDLPEPDTSDTDVALPERWTKLRPHEIQQKFLHSTARFNVVPSGRRSGKTEIGKRRTVMKALDCTIPDARFISGAPTFQQAKRIFWNDLKRLIPRDCVESISESSLCITLVTGTIVMVTGLDVPERIEGPPITGIHLDEYANMRPEVWTEHIRPGLSDHLGTADFTGVPEGRNHYYDLWRDAKDLPDWDTFEWHSADILPASEIEAAKRDLDELTFQQEYEAQFVTFSGRAYYPFTEANIRTVLYDPERDLVFCFDFNRSPGVAVVLQEFAGYTGVVGEVYIHRDSNTPKVCGNLYQRYGKHTGKVFIYGDASGGARTSSQTEGNDWELVRECLQEFTLRMEVPKANPSVRVRLNATNSRICSMSGERKLYVDPSCRYLCKDLEGVKTMPDGDIDKRDKDLTHITDALGYYISRAWPIVKRNVVVTQL